MICPNCKRDLARVVEPFWVHREVVKAMSRATEMSVGDAREFMAVHLIRAGLELRNFCADCVLAAQVSFSGGESGAVRSAEEAMRAATELQDLKERAQRLALVIPIRKDLIDIGAKYDSGEPKP